MQSYRKANRPLVAAKVRLSLAAAITAVFVTIFFSAGAGSQGGAGVGAAPSTCPAQLLQNGGFELPGTSNWSKGQWLPFAYLATEDRNAHSGTWTAAISASNMNDAWFSQEVSVEPQTQYLLTGWVKTKDVSGGVGANLSLIGTWTHSEGVLGTNDWTRVSLLFNSGDSTQITIGPRLGYWAGPSTGSAWFDDLRLTPIKPDGTHPRWKILVLIYDRTDAVLTDTGGVSHHMVGAMTPAEKDRATLAATQFVETDIPALTSGNMIPELTIRYPDHPLTQLDSFGQAWWPSPANTAPERDPAFDSVIVIWDPRVVDQYTGTRYWIGGGAGLTPPMGVGQTYATIIIEATGYGHRNVFKHELGHSILFYFDAVGTIPKPTVINHANVNQYVHWPSGENYVWVDETDANPIPNSIYNNASGFTHDYYSGTTATADDPTRRLGITPEAWMLGGPVTKPGSGPSFPPPVITCNANIVVANDPGTCSAKLKITRPAISDACDTDLVPVPNRSDGLPVDAAYSCGQTIITWTTTNSEGLTSTCQQVVTVTDAKAPEFIHVPPSVTVTTGKDATSCGTVVEESRLGSRAPLSDPTVVDPLGDTYPSWFSRRPDITSASATFDRESLSFTVSFAEQIFPASSDNSRRLIGAIQIDTDQNPGTGGASGLETSPPPLNLGVDYYVSLLSEGRHPGFVDVISIQGNGTVMGTVPVLFNDTGFSVTVPLALIGGDNGLVNYAVGMGVPDIGPTDRLPNGVEPATSVPVPELIAMDDCAGVSISRSGIPANNYFPVGETLITYTATDLSGHTASVIQKVTVVDDTAPVISGASASPSTLWPPNHDMMGVTVNYVAADNCAILETWLGVSSNETTVSESDWEIVDAHHVRLRAARSGRWGDRLYTITVTAKDIHGNLSSQNVVVRVPQKGKAGLRASAVTGQRLLAAPLVRSGTSQVRINRGPVRIDR